VTLFVYGELCKPAVLNSLLGRVPSGEAALLAGYRRALVPTTGYFCAVPREGAMIAGLLLGGITPDEIETLDGFENVSGGEYTRVEREVELLASGECHPAWVYVSSDNTDPAGS